MGNLVPPTPMTPEELRRADELYQKGERRIEVLDPRLGEYLKSCRNQRMFYIVSIGTSLILMVLAFISLILNNI